MVRVSFEHVTAVYPGFHALVNLELFYTWIAGRSIDLDDVDVSRIPISRS